MHPITPGMPATSTNSLAISANSSLYYTEKWLIHNSFYYIYVIHIILNPRYPFCQILRNWYYARVPRFSHFEHMYLKECEVWYSIFVKKSVYLSIGILICSGAIEAKNRDVFWIILLIEDFEIPCISADSESCPPFEKYLSAAKIWKKFIATLPKCC